MKIYYLPTLKNKTALNIDNETGTKTPANVVKLRTLLGATLVLVTILVCDSQVESLNEQSKRTFLSNGVLSFNLFLGGAIVISDSFGQSCWAVEFTAGSIAANLKIKNIK